MEGSFYCALRDTCIADQTVANITMIGVAEGPTWTTNLEMRVESNCPVLIATPTAYRVTARQRKMKARTGAAIPARTTRRQ
jgi:hypothetical protein